MNQFKRQLARLDSDQNPAYSLIRIFLGVILFVRGWILAADPDAIIELIGEHQLHIWFSYLTIGHLLGGLSITFGLLTRIGALLQVPILLTAVFMVHLRNGMLMTGDQSLELSVLVLFLLLIIMIFGSGRFSLDRYFHI